LYIARLQLKGFKSFGGVHDLPMSPGFTAVVGPNGSGKSNLLDALRWVLGDMNPGRLRIVRQSDLIFSGSLSLPRADEAEVAVQLRSEARSSLFRRKVQRDGTSLVLVDGARVRLQDLDEVKRAWNLEGDRFAFIGQGDVTEVVQQRPLARRMHLEALFGIDVYRRRRDDAVAKLHAAGAELARLETLMAELEARRVVIAPEVRKARIASTLRTELDEARRLLYWIRRGEAEREREELLAEACHMEERRTLAEKWLERWRALEERFVRESEQLSTGERALLEETERIARRRDVLRRQAFASGTALRHVKETLVRCFEQEARSEKALALAEEEALLRAAAFQDADAAFVRALQELEEADAVWRRHTEALGEERLLREELRAGLARVDVDLSASKGRLGALGKRVWELRTSCLEEEERLALLQKQRDEERLQEEACRREHEEAVLRHSDAYALCQEYAGELQLLRRETGRAASRLEEYRETAQGELYPRPVQHLVAAAKLGRLSARPLPLVEAFTCPSNLIRAVEAFLGGRQFWLLVETFDEAQVCIEQLKRTGNGRATFLPLERTHPRFPQKDLTLPRGVVGWAVELLQMDPHWESCVRHVLGDLLLVERYEVGASLSRSGCRVPVATLDGDVFLSSGTVSGGRGKSGPGAMELRRLMSEAEAEVSRLEASAKELAWSLREAEDRERAASKRKQETAEALAARERFLEEKERLLQSALREKLHREEELLRTKESLREEGRRYGELLRNFRELQERLQTLSALPEDRELESRVTALRATARLAEEKRLAAKDLAERTRASLGDLREALAVHVRDREELSRQGISEREKLALLGKEFRELQLQEEDLAWRLKRERLSLNTLHRRRDRARRGIRSGEERLAADREREMRTRRRIEDLQREVDDAVALWEEQFPYPGNSFHVPSEDTGALSPRERTEELRRTIRERERSLKALGDVDLGTLSEDRSLEERLAFLKEQVGDVRSGMEELRRFLEETDRHAGALFSKALEGIDQRFDALFQRLFGGGEARLSLAEGSELWEAGVEVIARPPGKKPQHLGQLSGGEQSLTAISLLFAAMEIAGVPLAVLDEVDAALDEVNLRRFAVLAKEYSRAIQIVAMTHRRYTMEQADLLYGVTMSEPGLSQVVGVRLEEWS
jgi:chromosome segregation protein